MYVSTDESMLTPDRLINAWDEQATLVQLQLGLPLAGGWHWSWLLARALVLAAPLLLAGLAAALVWGLRRAIPRR